MKNFGLINTLILILFVFSLLYPYLLFSLGGDAIPVWSYAVSFVLGGSYVLVVIIGPKTFVEIESIEAGSDTVLEESKVSNEVSVNHEKLKDLAGDIDAVLALELSEDNKKSELANLLMSKLATIFEIGQGAMYFSEKLEDKNVLVFKGGYAYHKVEEGVYIDFGEGLTGQVAKAQKKIILDLVPEGYITIFSGLGESTPSHLYIYPIIDGDETLAVIEMASFTEINSEYISMFENELTRISKYIRENF